MTPEAKALMEQILASNGSKEEIASRVEALLAGSELSSSRGVNGGFDGSKSFLSFPCTGMFNCSMLYFSMCFKRNHMYLNMMPVRQKGTYSGLGT